MAQALFGKSAIVTGAGSGIGRAICNILVRDGAKIIAADVNLDAAKETISKMSDSATAMKLDVTNRESVNKALQASVELFKRPPTIVVNSAGIIQDAYFLKMSDLEFDNVIKVNLKGTFLMMQVFAQSLVEYKVGGSIINLSSIVAKLNSVGQSNYAASKAGVLSLTKVGSKEFGKFNIRVNAVLPGYIDTPMVKGIPEKDQKAILQQCPIGRIGKPDEVAEVVSFLSSGKASYINGAFIEVTGGL